MVGSMVNTFKWQRVFSIISQIRKKLISQHDLSTLGVLLFPCSVEWNVKAFFSVFILQICHLYLIAKLEEQRHLGLLSFISPLFLSPCGLSGVLVIYNIPHFMSIEKITYDFLEFLSVRAFDPCNVILGRPPSTIYSNMFSALAEDTVNLISFPLAILHLMIQWCYSLWKRTILT